MSTRRHVVFNTETDELSIDGAVYSGAFFDAMKNPDPAKLYRIVRKDDGTITIEDASWMARGSRRWQ